jgi:GTP cyclohydrolase II
MVVFDEMIRRVRSGEWVQFFSEGNCYRFLASEIGSKLGPEENIFNDLNRFNIALTGHRLKALGSKAVDDSNNIYSLNLSNFELIAGLINPLSRLSEKVEIESASIPLNSDFNLVMKMIKWTKLLPSFIFYESAFNPKLPLLDLDSVRDKLNHKMLNLEKVSEVRVPLSQTDDALFVAFRPNDGGPEHIAIVVGDIKATENPLIRIHSECFTGDLFSSLRCDCGSQLKGAIDMMCQQKSGVLIYLAQEGRGIGLLNKLRSYQLQDQGVDTVDANLKLGFDADERNYLVASKILEMLSINSIKLLTNNPDKIASLQKYGIQVIERVAHVFPANPFNQPYMNTKKLKSGHLF